MLHDNREGLQYYFTLRASPMRRAIFDFELALLRDSLHMTQSNKILLEIGACIYVREASKAKRLAG